MAKYGVFKIDNTSIFRDTNILKRSSLLFDKILVRERIVYTEEDRIKYNVPDDLWAMIGLENHTFDFLQENGILEIYTIPSQQLMSDADERKPLLDELFNSLLKESDQYIELRDAFNNNDLDRIKLLRKDDLLGGQISDLSLRIDALSLMKGSNSVEFYPILSSDYTYKTESKKEHVISFMLSDIPIPNEDVAWEQIIDFRQDVEVRNKYLALLNWINEISNSSFSIAEIKEKYEYLHSEYLKHFKLHKMKYNISFLEILIPAGASLLFGQPFLGLKLASDFIKMKLLSVSLLEEEGKLPGKEIAYIYKVNEKFK
jgi:hypothetical protein